METEMLFSASHLREVLGEMAEDLAANYRDQLLRSDRVASRALYNSVSARVEANGHAWEVKMSMLEYWKYIERGTRPHWPPVSKILEWVQIKPVIPRPGRDGRVPTPKQLAYLIARKIAREGTEGKPDLKDTVDRVLAWYLPRISEALGKDALQYVTQVFEG